MKLSRKNVLAMAGIVAVAGIVGASAEAAGEMNGIRGKTYVAACPPVKESIPRTPGPKMLEAYEISEYGRPPIEEDFELLMGMSRVPGTTDRPTRDIVRGGL